jgi:hypothetical protein
MAEQIKERPILMSQPMVLAILAGQKTQTRRIAPIDGMEITSHANGMTTWIVNFSKPVKGSLGTYSGTRCTVSDAQKIIASQYCAYGSVGMRLWVREAWRAECTYDDVAPRDMAWDEVQIRYEADGAWNDHDAMTASPGRYRHGMHMPRWASRILLEITDVRIQRLHEISESDCWAEGIEFIDGMFDVEIYEMAKRIGVTFEDAKPTFACLWESINGAGSWDANPFVWAISFKRVKP